ALMLACYSGQLINVIALMKNGVDINRQQTLSGRSALFFAALGCRDFPDNYDNYLSILHVLLDNKKTNAFIQEKGAKIFLHTVVECFKAKDVSSIISTLLAKKVTMDDIC